MTENTRTHGVLFVAACILIVCIASAYSSYLAIPVAEKRLKVSVLYRGGRADAYNDMALSGAARAAKAFGQNVAVREVKTLDYGNNQEFVLRLQAQSEADVIICVGYDYVEAVRKVAPEYPHIRYVIIDGYIPQLTSADYITCVLFKEREGAFLVGAAAALRSQTGVVGFIGGADTDFVHVFEDGYTDGARYINPSIRVLAEYVGKNGSAFNNPDKAFQLALAQYANGADIVFHAAGSSGLGVLEAAASQKHFMIGVDSDQSLSARSEQRPYILTSMVKRVDAAVFNSIEQALTGSLAGGYYEFGLKEGGVDYAVNDYNHLVLEPMKPTLDEIKKKIVMGEIMLPAQKR